MVYCLVGEVNRKWMKWTNKWTTKIKPSEPVSLRSNASCKSSIAPVSWRSRVRIPLKPSFFQASSFQLLKLEIYCDDHSSLSSTTAIHMNYFIYASHHFTPHGRYEVNKLTSLPMCGFIAQLVEHRTGIAEVTGSNPVEALIFSGFLFPIA